MEIKEIKQQLVERRKRLQDDRERSEGNDVADVQQQDQSADLSSYDQHPSDQGSETFERERALAIMDQIDERIEEVDAALRRLESGEFGKCEICGRTIPEERLKARPEARFCVEHQAEVERGMHPSLDT